MTEIESAINLLKQDDWIVCPPLVPGSPLPEPKHGQLWVSPNPRVAPRFVGESQSPWIIDYAVSGDDGWIGLPRGTFLAWARRCGARPVMLETKPIEIQTVEVPQAVETPQIVLPFWKRIFGARG